jgi:SAM-dependent methyltransferase
MPPTWGVLSRHDLVTQFLRDSPGPVCPADPAPSRGPCEVLRLRTTRRAFGSRPAPFSVITTRALWTDPHVSEQMLRYHLDPTVDTSSRRPQAIDAAVAWTTATFALGPGASVLDLGCGPGLYTSRWAAGGADVTGIDFSARSIAYARGAAERDGLQIRYVAADYLEWQADRTFDLVTMIMCDFSALSPAQRSVLLESVGRWLGPNGAFLFDVEALPYLASRKLGRLRIEHPHGGFWAAGPHSEIAETLTYPEERVSLDRYTLSEAGRTWTIWNWLQAYDPASLTEVLRQAGYTVDAVLGDLTGRPYESTAPEFAVVARAGSSR